MFCKTQGTSTKTKFAVIVNIYNRIGAKFHIATWCFCRFRGIFVCVVFEIHIKKVGNSDI